MENILVGTLAGALIHFLACQVRSITVTSCGVLLQQAEPRTPDANEAASAAGQYAAPASLPCVFSAKQDVKSGVSAFRECSGETLLTTGLNTHGSAEAQAARNL